MKLLCQKLANYGIMKNIIKEEDYAMIVVIHSIRKEMLNLRKIYYVYGYEDGYVFFQFH